MNSNKHGLSDRWAVLFHNQWMHLTLIVLIGTAIYSNSFHVPFVLDDNYSIDFFGSSTIYDLLFHGGSRRIADVTFAINHKLHGAWLPGYHITNLLIHLAASITLYYLVTSAIHALAKVSVDPNSFMYRFLPCATVLLFVSHPLQTQAVTYTIQRYTSLSAFFYLFSALAFIKFRTILDNGTSQKLAWSWAGISLLTAFLSFESKQIAATLPVMMLVIEHTMFEGRFLTRRFYAGCGVLLLSIPAYLLFQWFNGTLDDFLYDLRHATTDNVYMSRTTYLLTQTRVVVTYLRLLILPVNQNLFYDYPTYSDLFSDPVLSSMALHATLAGAAIFMLRSARKHDSQGDATHSTCLRLASFGIVWFYLTLTVESSIVPIRDVIFEHRVYLPSAGIFLSLCSMAVLAVKNQQPAKPLAWSVLAICTIVLGCSTFARNQVWGNAVTIWQDTALKSPNKGLVQANLAAEYLKIGQADKALPLFLKAIELSPNLDFRVKTGLGGAMQALNLYPGRYTTGHEYILPGGTFNSGALNFGNFNQWEAVICNNKALVYEYYGNDSKAWDAYQNAIWIYPSYDLAWYNFGLLAARLQQWEKTREAIDHLKKLNPGMAKSLEMALHH